MWMNVLASFSYKYDSILMKSILSFSSCGNLPKSLSADAVFWVRIFESSKLGKTCLSAVSQFCLIPFHLAGIFEVNSYLLAYQLSCMYQFGLSAEHFWGKYWGKFYQQWQFAPYYCEGKRMWVSDGKSWWSGCAVVKSIGVGVVVLLLTSAVSLSLAFSQVWSVCQSASVRVLLREKFQSLFPSYPLLPMVNTKSSYHSWIV